MSNFLINFIIDIIKYSLSILFIYLIYRIISSLLKSFLSHGWIFSNTESQSKLGKAKIAFKVVNTTTGTSWVTVDNSKVPNYNRLVLEFIIEDKLFCRFCHEENIESSNRENDSFILPIEFSTFFKSIKGFLILIKIIKVIILHKLSDSINKPKIILLDKNNFIDNIVKNKIDEYDQIRWFIQNR